MIPEIKSIQHPEKTNLIVSVKEYKNKYFSDHLAFWPSSYLAKALSKKRLPHPEFDSQQK